jgi:hypothetical protein
MIQNIPFAPNLILTRELDYDADAQRWEVTDWVFVDDRGRQVEVTDHMLEAIGSAADDVASFGGLEFVQGELDGQQECRAELNIDDCLVTCGGGDRAYRVGRALIVDRQVAANELRKVQGL